MPAFLPNFMIVFSFISSSIHSSSFTLASSAAIIVSSQNVPLVSLRTNFSNPSLSFLPSFKRSQTIPLPTNVLAAYPAVLHANPIQHILSSIESRRECIPHRFLLITTLSIIHHLSLRRCLNCREPVFLPNLHQ